MRLAQGRIRNSPGISPTRWANAIAYRCLWCRMVSPFRAQRGNRHSRRIPSVATRYILLAARLVPEKGRSISSRHMQKLENSGFDLVLAGGAEFGGAYEEEVRALASRVPGVVLTGFQTGDRLAELFANAALFVLPVEPRRHADRGFWRRWPMVSRFWQATSLPTAARFARDDYFPLGNVDALSSAIAEKIANPPTNKSVRADRARRNRL